MFERRVGAGAEKAESISIVPPTAPYCFLFFVSGFPALIYQIVWQRALFTIYGVNIESVTMIVTVFMLGLGLGSLAGGKLSKDCPVPIPVAFGAIEICIGAFGAGSLALFHRVAVWTAGVSTARAGLWAAGLLLLPTLMMGSTLPLLVTHVVRINRNVGESVGLLYAVNTLGSAAACAVAAFFTMRLLGQSGSVRLAATLNVLVGISAVLLPRPRPSPASALVDQKLKRETGAAPALSFTVGLVLAALTGAIALGYEIVWYRLYSFASGGLAASFALVLAVYLGGIAFGSLLMHDFCRDRLRAKSDGTRGILGNLMLWAAVASFLVGPALGLAVRHVSLRVTFPLVFLPAALLGATFPLLAHSTIAPSSETGRRLSYLYLANIIGSAFGSIVVGFILMDIWSTQQISICLLGASVIPAGILLHRGSPGVRVGGGAAFFIALLIAVFSRDLFSDLYLHLLLKQEKSDISFRDVVETRSGVISVSKDGTVFGGGVYDGRFNTDLVHDTNGIVRAFAIAELHPNPAEVLMIGLSSGSWAQVIANHTAVKRMTAVEINPGYLRLIDRYPVVSGLLRNPKFHVDIDDGRRWLFSHPGAKFDLIVMNTTYHWRSNVSNLLSVEFLKLAREHLQPGGILFYNTTDSDEALLTGATVFPYSVRVWNFIAVSDSPIPIDKDHWEEQLTSYAIEGMPVFNLSDPAQRNRLEEVISILDSINLPDQPHERGMEWGESMRLRLKGRRLITDDNMGQEW